MELQMREKPPSQLPQELVTHVLRHADLQQRLGSCSLVCHTWRAAAAAASSDVRLDGTSCLTPISGLRIKSLGHWLLQHAAGVTQLEVHTRSIVLQAAPGTDKVLQLPAAQMQRLQTLSVSKCHLEVQQGVCGVQQQQQQQQLPHALRTITSSSSSSSDSGRQALTGLSSLTSLLLSSVGLIGPVGLGGLSALSGLQQLQLSEVTVTKQVLEVAPTPSAAQAKADQSQQQREQQLKHDILLGLGSLTQLTQLELPVQLLPKAAVAPFSCLQQLQTLILSEDVNSYSRELSPATLLRLPPSLTHLELVWREEQVLSSSLCPGLASLTNLQYLSICAENTAGLLPDFCSGMQQLTELRLFNNLSRDALPTLTRVLPALSRLESLLIENTGAVTPLPASDVAGYSTLLPLSQHITSIQLQWWEEAGLLRPGCGPHLFAAGRQLPKLKQLLLGVPDNWDAWESDMRLGGLATCVSNVGGECLGEGSLRSLVRCCPGLEYLAIAGLVEPDVQMQPLLQLTALTGLSVGGEAVTDDVAHDVLSKMRGLRRLGVFYAEGFSDCGLLALTKLQQLTHLAVGSCSISSDVSAKFAQGGEVQDDDSAESLELQLQDLLPPVWLQLLSRCVRSNQRSRLTDGSCGEVALEELMDVQRDTQDIMAMKERQLRMAATMAAAAAAELATRKQQAHAQQQLAAAAARATELEQRLAAAEAAAAAATTEEQACAQAAQQQLAAAEALATELERRLAAAEAAAAAAAAVTTREEQLRADASQKQLAAAEARAQLERRLAAAEAELAGYHMQI
uniref:F-box domain-containing protein n=1 Tax=Tetradesmus obliquus TaxID=3088 RepID=A0A383VKR1_TETOB|eukprot:jgi/Sobl393_1/18585/SZX65322.1